MQRGTTTRRVMGALLTVGFVAGSGAVLAGCSGDPEPTPSPSVSRVSPSPTPTPTPTPTPEEAVKPAQPPAMEVPDATGAEATAAYFLLLFPYVYATNDLVDWRLLSHPECVYCAGVIQEVEAQAAVGVHSVGGLITVAATTTSAEVEPGRRWSVVAEIVQHPSRDLDATGRVVAEVPEKSFHMELDVIFENQEWVIREVSLERTDA
jgi:hypothetical protein